LTPDEFDKMKEHTTKGAAIVATIPGLDPQIIPIVRNHHERWDGTGYPDGLAKEKIPLLARIVAVADAFDAMTSERPYHTDKKAHPPEWAFGEIQRMSGRQFDPQCVTAFLAIQEQVIEVMRSDHQTSLVTDARPPR
jgi:HD-GYP domain-containing protein (c-di-GMP phosphodiesterase class II)